MKLRNKLIILLSLFIMSCGAENESAYNEEAIRLLTPYDDYGVDTSYLLNDTTLVVGRDTIELQ